MILIIGGRGFLGYFLHQGLTKLGKETHSTFNKNIINEENFHPLDLDDNLAVMKIIDEKIPDIIIYTAGLTNVDLCEENNRLAKAINVNGIKNVIEGAKKYNSKIIYISTSAVFSGKKDEYFEDDKPDPISFYGKTKLDGENLVVNSGLKNLIIRTDQPYGWKKEWHHTNSVLRTLESLGRKEVFREISDWYNTPTYVEDFVLATNKLIEEEETGIFHVVGNDFDNRFNFSETVAEIFGLDSSKIQAIESSELNLPAKRSNAKLVSSKIKNYNIIMSNFHDGLKKMRGTSKDNGFE